MVVDGDNGSGQGKVRIQKTMELVKLAIGGMTCEGCVRTVERRLKSLPGVQSARVSLGAGEAEIGCLPGAMEATDLAAAVEKLGYSASVK